ncbi:hypothetical protein HMPREF9098_0702 [Kingella denitrificans ATCC 33394]|uniref:Uncharacterized protein n=1 Tax=Kingella denitrificans ATCC 33394 TaxID=888741 RepID=F0EXZ2_9NEIS|nr:hypothetical protein HMPREF9098_0702 [Kingella denitrificans ATCC 33394]
MKAADYTAQKSSLQSSPCIRAAPRLYSVLLFGARILGNVMGIFNQHGVGCFCRRPPKRQGLA